MSINSRNGNTLLESGYFPPVRAATTAAITLAGLQTIDGVGLAEADRVLVKDQVDQTQNGIYAASSGNWVRTTDAISNTHFFDGMAVNVAQGTLSAGHAFICTSTDDPVVIGTSNITFAAQIQFAGNVTGPGSSVAGHIAVFADTSGSVIEDGGAAGNVTGPVSSTAGHVAVFADTSGEVLEDGGVADVAGPGSSTTGHVAVFADASGKVLADGGASAGGDVTGPGSSTTGHLAVFADTSGKVLSDGGAPGAGSAKAWVVFTVVATVVTVQASFNIASVVRQSTGQFHITFTSAMTDANYAALVTSANRDIGSWQISSPGANPTTTDFYIVTNNALDSSGDIEDPARCSVVVFGN